MKPANDRNPPVPACGEDGAPHALLPNCRVIREIGRGEYGVVYLARRGGAYCALKEVRRAASQGQQRMEPCDRELRGVRLVRRLPKIHGLVRIFDLAEAPDGSAFAYSMELADPELDGEGPESEAYRPRTLASVIDAEVALPFDECLEIAIRIANALAELQRHHVLHRDIKPGNIIFVGGKAVLADVGLATDARDASSIVGTPGYAPPERFGSPTGDIFSLGKTLYRISTGRLPTEEGLPPCIEADIDAPFFWKWMMVLSKATARSPAQRYRSAKGFLRDLRRIRAQASMCGRTARRIAAAAAAAFALLVLLPALWNSSVWKAWSAQNQIYKDNISLPWPYSLIRPFFVSKNAPAKPRNVIPIEYFGVTDDGKNINDVVKETQDKLMDAIKALKKDAGPQEDGSGNE